MKDAEVKEVIKCIHRIWYQDWLENKILAYELHQHLGELFNYADITETLCENNPGRVTPTEFLQAEFTNPQEQEIRSEG